MSADVDSPNGHLHPGCRCGTSNICKGVNMVAAASPRQHKPPRHKILGYEDRRGIFAASWLTKTDDIDLLVNKLDRHRIRIVRDFCGGYGRARLHWPSSVYEWMVLDNSNEMRSVGRRLLSEHSITHTRFVDFDLDSLQTKMRIAPGDLSLLLYNSINELKVLDPCFGNIAQLTKTGGLLFIKSIVHDKEQAKRTTIVTEIPLFLAFDKTLWKGRIISRRRSQTSPVQNVAVEFEQIGSGAKVSYRLRRTIWPTAEIDAHARRHGFSLLWRVSGSGYALFQKECS